MLRLTNGQRSLITCTLLLALCVFVAFYPFTLLSVPNSQLHLFLTQPRSSHLDNRCHPRLVPPNTVVIVKTGANEVYQKVPTQILTALHCCQDLLFFSDLDQKLGPYFIHDALANVSDSVKLNNSQFDYYRTLQEYRENGQDIGTTPEPTHDAAWQLDKYKFLHMLEKSWALRPGREWYVYIEADTYLVQSNLRLWLQRLDSSKPLFIGSPTYFKGEAFAHGGSGFILSGTALSQFADGDHGVAARYDEMVRDELYGDYVLMKALKDKGIKFRSAWPMLQAEKPTTIPFGPGPDNGVRHWCQPIVTMHHITPSEASRTWSFEQQRKDPTQPLLLKELYAGSVAPEVPAEREDWYNLSDDRMYRAPGVHGARQKPQRDMTRLEERAYMSFEDCGRACEEEPRCYQFVYSNQTCGFSYSYRLGWKQLPGSDGKTYKSGWALDKIARDQAGSPCNVPRWL